MNDLEVIFPGDDNREVRRMAQDLFESSSETPSLEEYVDRQSGFWLEPFVPYGWSAQAWQEKKDRRLAEYAQMVREKPPW